MAGKTCLVRRKSCRLPPVCVLAKGLECPRGRLRNFGSGALIVRRSKVNQPTRPIR